MITIVDPYRPWLAISQPTSFIAATACGLRAMAEATP